MCCCGWFLSWCASCNGEEKEKKEEEDEPFFPRNDPIGYQPVANQDMFNGISIQSIPGEIDDDQTYIAQYDFLPLIEMDLEAKKGDPIEIIEEESSYSQWCFARNKRTDKSGLIPTTYIAKLFSLENHDWYFSGANRPAAETLLLSSENKVGTFLVRPSGNDIKAPYILSLRSQDSENKPIVKHFKIFSENNTYFILHRPPRPSLQLLIDFYLRDPENTLKLEFGLKVPCKKIRPLLLNFGPRVKNGEIDRREIVIDEDNHLGSGNFSEVFSCMWNNIQVAVKKIRCKESKTDLIKEINILRTLKHKQIVSCYCTCTEKQPYLIVLEYLPNGDLQGYLQSTTLILYQKLYMISQIVSGMEYLERKRVVHRDLAARNVLVGDRLTVKIADFGLSRILNSDGEYSLSTNVQLPIKWTAFECFEEFKFTNKSDVWSFGILLMEIFTNGARPYSELKKSDKDSLQAALKSGHRMPKPEECPEKIYEKILHCWALNPNERPNFKEIGIFFFKICDDE